MTPRCIWCLEPIVELELPPPAGFCSADCHARYRFACAELGDDLHKAGAVSIGTLQRDFEERASRYFAADIVRPRPQMSFPRKLADLVAFGVLFWLSIEIARRIQGLG